VFFGSGAFAIPSLEALLASPHVTVVTVVTAPDRPVGRRAEPTPTPVAARARAAGLALSQPPRVRAPEVVAELAALAPELGVLADYGQIVPPAVLELPARGILNVHPSLLPRHRGATPVPATILAGDAEAGVTIIRMDAGLDTGPIVAAAAGARATRQHPRSGSPARA
jgi:methionyl-tRNA formyltransferase